MLFIYLYHGDLYSDLWKSDLQFRPAVPFVFSRTRTSRAGVLKMPRASKAFKGYT